MNKKSSQSSKQYSMRPFSSILVDGPERAAGRSMLYPVGFTDEDVQKLIIGIASIPPVAGSRRPASGDAH